MNIGDTLRQFRDSLGVKVETIATALGKAPSTISRIENNQIYIKKKYFVVYCTNLGFDIAIVEKFANEVFSSDKTSTKDPAIAKVVLKFINELGQKKLTQKNVLLNENVNKIITEANKATDSKIHNNTSDFKEFWNPN